MAVVVCDLDLPDEPIVYASDAFYELTGYSENEVLGRNCRFLQRAGPGSSPAAVAAAVVDKPAARRMHHAIHSQYEIQLQVHNYKRNGQPFTNILSIIPIQLASNGRRYAVGFQSELQ